MNAKIRSLASLIRGKKEEQRKKFVLMLGAGASLSSGVRPTNTIMEGLLAEYGHDLTEGSVRDRFDRLLDRSNPAERDLLLRPFLDCRKLRPSAGYGHLAGLIARGYFDLVVTFNFDQLLETALEEAGLRLNDFQVIVRGHSDEDVRAALEMPQPRVKILKVHGGLSGGDTFLFTRQEMHEYPEPIKTLLRQLTSQDILVCGYSFADLCMVRAFSNDGGTICCVNPGGAPEYLVSFMINRLSRDWSINGSSGYFDAFFAELDQALTAAAEPEERPKANPFRFLVSYDVRDKPWYYGRRKETEEVVSKLQTAPPPKVLHLYGPAKAGKTSLVRAGVIASLDPALYSPVYLRCQAPLEKCVQQAIARLIPPVDPQEDVKAAVRRLAASTTKHVVMVLDQFERVVKPYAKSESGQKQLINCLNGLCECACPNLSFLCVATDDKDYLKALMKVKGEFLEVAPLGRLRVGAIIRLLARRAGIEFEPGVIQAIMKRYDETAGEDQPFTLAHVQAVCNILAGSTHVDMASYERVMQDDGEALDIALNAFDIVSFVEDIPDEKGRNLFRKVMKVIPVEGKKKLARYLNENFSDLFTPPEFPEETEQSRAVGHG